jgi:hypothetical protein
VKKVNSYPHLIHIFQVLFAVKWLEKSILCLFFPAFSPLRGSLYAIVDNEVDLELPDVSGAVLLYAARTVPCHAPTVCWLLRHSKNKTGIAFPLSRFCSKLYALYYLFNSDFTFG